MSFDNGDATDESGNGNHGKLDGALPTAGKVGCAMQFADYLKSWAGSLLRYCWSKRIPLLIRAMVLANKTLFVAGPPNLVDEEEAFDYSNEPDILEKLRQQDAALDVQHDALRKEFLTLLWAVSTSDCERLAEYNLDSLPVFDGMIAANNRLFVATKNGKLLCFDKQ